MVDFQKVRALRATVALREVPAQPVAARAARAAGTR
jgi:hypothetical protein